MIQNDEASSPPCDTGAGDCVKCGTSYSSKVEWVQHLLLHIERTYPVVTLNRDDVDKLKNNIDIQDEMSDEGGTDVTPADEVETKPKLNNNFVDHADSNNVSSSKVDGERRGSVSGDDDSMSICSSTGKPAEEAPKIVVKAEVHAPDAEPPPEANGRRSSSSSQGKEQSGAEDDDDGKTSDGSKSPAKPTTPSLPFAITVRKSEDLMAQTNYNLIQKRLQELYSRCKKKSTLDPPLAEPSFGAGSRAGTTNSKSSGTGGTINMVSEKQESNSQCDAVQANPQGSQDDIYDSTPKLSECGTENSYSLEPAVNAEVDSVLKRIDFSRLPDQVDNIVESENDISLQITSEDCEWDCNIDEEAKNQKPQSPERVVTPPKKPGLKPKISDYFAVTRKSKPGETEPLNSENLSDSKGAAAELECDRQERKLTQDQVANLRRPAAAKAGNPGDDTWCSSRWDMSEHARTRGTMKSELKPVQTDRSSRRADFVPLKQILTDTSGSNSKQLSGRNSKFDCAIGLNMSSSQQNFVDSRGNQQRQKQQPALTDDAGGNQQKLSNSRDRNEQNQHQQSLAGSSQNRPHLPRNQQNQQLVSAADAGRNKQSCPNSLDRNIPNRDQQSCPGSLKKNQQISSELMVHQVGRDETSMAANSLKNQQCSKSLGRSEETRQRSMPSVPEGMSKRPQMLTTADSQQKQNRPQSSMAGDSRQNRPQCSVTANTRHQLPARPQSSMAEVSGRGHQSNDVSKGMNRPQSVKCDSRQQQGRQPSLAADSRQGHQPSLAADPRQKRPQSSMSVCPGRKHENQVPDGSQGYSQLDDNQQKHHPSVTADSRQQHLLQPSMPAEPRHRQKPPQSSMALRDMQNRPESRSSGHTSNSKHTFTAAECKISQNQSALTTGLSNLSQEALSSSQTSLVGAVRNVSVKLSREISLSVAPPKKDLQKNHPRKTEAEVGRSNPERRAFAVQPADEDSFDADAGNDVSILLDLDTVATGGSQNRHPVSNCPKDATYSTNDEHPLSNTANVRRDMNSSTTGYQNAADAGFLSGIGNLSQEVASFCSAGQAMTEEQIDSLISSVLQGRPGTTISSLMQADFSSSQAEDSEPNVPLKRKPYQRKYDEAFIEAQPTSDSSDWDSQTVLAADNRLSLDSDSSLPEIKIPKLPPFSEAFPSKFKQSSKFQEVSGGVPAAAASKTAKANVFKQPVHKTTELIGTAPQVPAKWPNKDWEARMRKRRMWRRAEMRRKKISLRLSKYKHTPVSSKSNKKSRPILTDTDSCDSFEVQRNPKPADLDREHNFMDEFPTGLSPPKPLTPVAVSTSVPITPGKSYTNLQPLSVSFQDTNPDSSRNPSHPFPNQEDFTNGEFQQKDLFRCALCPRSFGTAAELDAHAATEGHIICSMSDACASLSFDSQAALSHHQAMVHQAPAQTTAVQRLAAQVERLPQTFGTYPQQPPQAFTAPPPYGLTQPSYNGPKLGSQVVLTPMAPAAPPQPPPNLPNLPGIQVTKRPAPPPVEASPNKMTRVEDTMPSIRLPDSITLVKSQPAPPPQNAVADMLATRGITMVASGSRAGVAPATSIQPVAPAKRLPNVPSAISIVPSRAQPSPQAQRFAVPPAPRGRNVTNLGTVDLTRDDQNGRRGPAGRPNPNSPRRFSCTICDKVYPTGESLQAHMAVHGSNKPGRYMCDICRVVYTNEAKLLHHKKTVHAVRAPTDTEMVIPICDINQPGVKEKLLQCGIRHVVQVQSVRNANDTAAFGLPIIPIDLARNEAYSRLDDLGASNILSLGNLRNIYR